MQYSKWHQRPLYHCEWSVKGTATRISILYLWLSDPFLALCCLSNTVPQWKIPTTPNIFKLGFLMQVQTGPNWSIRDSFPEAFKNLPKIFSHRDLAHVQLLHKVGWAELQSTFDLNHSSFLYFDICCHISRFFLVENFNCWGNLC